MTLTIKVLTLIYVITGMAVMGEAQNQQSSNQAIPNFVAIGERAPNIELPTIMNFPRASASLQDFKGKLLILDFWATYCPPCIISMPKLSELQKQFDDKIQVLLVGAEDEPMARKLFASKPQIQLPNALGVYQQLAQHFGVPALDTFVWIDSHGVVRAVTDGEQVRAEHIQAILEGRPVKLTSQMGYGPRIKFDRHSPFLIDGNGAGAADLRYHSIISGALRGVGPVMVTDRKEPYKDRRIFVANYTIQALYLTAFGDDAPGGPGSQFSRIRHSLEVANPGRFTQKENENLYCYELIVPIEMAGRLRQMMRADLDRFFGTIGTIEKRKVKAMVLTRIGKDSVKLPPHEPLEPWMVAAGIPEGEGQLHMHDYPITLQQLLEYFVKVPTLDETGLSGMVDLGYGYKELFVERKGDMAYIRNTLTKYGIALQEAEREVDFLVIRDDPARR